MRPFVLVNITLALLLAGCAVLVWQGSPWWILLIPVLLHGLVLTLGAIYIRWNFFLPALHHGSREKQKIALTFDDGPAEYSERILDILKKEAVPAAFFLIGKNVAAKPELVRRMVEEGHLVGNHSFHHGFHFDWKSAPSMFAEMQDCNSAIQHAAGVLPALFRPPYGVTNPNLATAVKQSKMTAIGWSLRSFDTRAKSGEALHNRIMNELKNGDVILLHDSVACTAEVLTTLIHTARNRGFTFVSLSDLLHVEPYKN